MDSHNYWYGVLAMDFPLSALNRYLAMVNDEEEGDVYLYDSRLQPIAASGEVRPMATMFNNVELAQLAKDFESDTEGGLWLDSRYVNWVRLTNFDGVLIRVHTIEEGVHGKFANITIALMLFWTLFSVMLLGSWLVIRRMVHNMSQLQNTLEWQAWHDPLTRLFNRRALFERALVLAERAKAQGLPYAVIQIDLDHFKNINDRYGHHAGDRVLSHAASLVAGSLRTDDVSGRVGGEEFCVVLPGTTLEDATRIASRIRERINAREILIRQKCSIRISASFGVSSSVEQEEYDFEHLRTRADDRLYRAKENGRNQVCASDEPPASA